MPKAVTKYRFTQSGPKIQICKKKNDQQQIHIFVQWELVGHYKITGNYQDKSGQGTYFRIDCFNDEKF